MWLHGDGLCPVFAHDRPDAEPGTARTTAMTQRVRALTAMAAGDEPNILRLWNARTQNHAVTAVRGFMVTDFTQVRLSRRRHSAIVNITTLERIRS